MAGLIDRFDDPVSWADGYASGFDSGVQWARDQMDLALAAAVDPGPLVDPQQRAQVNARGASEVIRRLVRVMSRAVQQQ